MPVTSLIFSPLLSFFLLLSVCCCRHSYLHFCKYFFSKIWVVIQWVFLFACLWEVLSLSNQIVVSIISYLSGSLSNFSCYLLRDCLVYQWDICIACISSYCQFLVFDSKCYYQWVVIWYCIGSKLCFKWLRRVRGVSIAPDNKKVINLDPLLLSTQLTFEQIFKISIKLVSKTSVQLHFF